MLADGLVVVPFTALSYEGQILDCDNTGGGVQVVEWGQDTLRKRALLPLPGHPLRAFEHEGEMVAVSDSNGRAYSLSDLDVAQQSADLTIGTCKVPPRPYTFEDYEDYPRACSALAAHSGSEGWGSWLCLVALAFRGLKRRRRSM